MIFGKADALNEGCRPRAGEMAQSLEPLLLQSARLAVSIRRTYAKVKRDPLARYYTYVLQLQGDKLYVGNTDNIYNRLLDPHLMSRSAAVWVRQHGPVRRVLEVSRNCCREDEMYKTLEYMSMFGWDNVRGAGYCRCVMRSPPAPLAQFKRDASRHFDYLTREEIDEVLDVVRDLADLQAASSSDEGSCG